MVQGQSRGDGCSGDSSGPPTAGGILAGWGEGSRLWELDQEDKRAAYPYSSQAEGCRSFVRRGCFLGLIVPQLHSGVYRSLHKNFLI